MSLQRREPINIIEASPIADTGSDVFVYEYIYITGATSLQKMSYGSSPTVVNQISGTNGVFYLTESAVNGQYGTYNVTGAAADPKMKQINIWYPEISLGAELSPAAGDSIDGKPEIAVPFCSSVRNHCCKISGSADGDPSCLQLYLFGPNKYVTESITVEDDGTYEKKLDIGSECSSKPVLRCYRAPDV